MEWCLLHRNEKPIWFCGREWKHFLKECDFLICVFEGVRDELMQRPCYRGGSILHTIQFTINAHQSAIGNLVI